MDIKSVTSLYTAEFLSKHDNAMLIDVRTSLEWQQVGLPLSNHDQLTLLSWRLLPNMQINPTFENDLINVISDKNISLFFICKLGGRSYEAAELAFKLGYKKCYNVVDGFEGTNDLTGWKNNGLPFQSYIVI